MAEEKEIEKSVQVVARISPILHGMLAYIGRVKGKNNPDLINEAIKFSIAQGLWIPKADMEKNLKDILTSIK